MPLLNRRKLKHMSSTAAKTPNCAYHSSGPSIRNSADGNLELVMMRWGFPPIPGEKAPITNIRNLQSRWWRDVNREWILEQQYRCLVPFTAFAEPVRDSTWFHVPGVEVACFAGIWRPWQGERLTEQPGQKRRVRTQGDWKLYSFLTTDANDVVKPVHEKAMPVILIDPKEQAEWLNGGEASFYLQRPCQMSCWRGPQIIDFL